jgi:PLD-like domain
MVTRLVDSDWPREIAEAVRYSSSMLRIVSPFIKDGALQRHFNVKSTALQVVTRFKLADFAEGVSDIAALRRLLVSGGRVRGIKNLHAKMYLFGSTRAIVSSANLTEAALGRNIEFGVVSDDMEIVAACHQYFEDIWRRGGDDLTIEQLEQWDEKVSRHRAEGGRPNRHSGLGDYGADAGMTDPPTNILPIAVADASQAFVKFQGEGSNREPLSFPTIDEVKRAGCHWALTYPAKKRPSGVHDGAIMFISRLTKDPNDIRVFGRAIGSKHKPGRDDATSEDIELRSYKQSWSRYVRIAGAEFVAGTMANGVSLNELMSELGSDSFISTQRNERRGVGNTDPRRAYMQQASVELSDIGRQWLAEQLQSKFDLHGTIPQADLDHLDWPQVPRQ